MSTASLMLLPGLLCDERVWRDQRAALAARVDCRVIDYGTRASLVAMAEQVLAEAPTERFGIAGHSMGARVALEVLRRAPQRVERIALLDFGVDALPPGAAGDDERSKRLALVAQARRDGMGAMGRAWARGMVHPSVLDSALFDEIIAMIERKPLAVYEGQIRSLIERPDARDVLAAARCPTLLICGRQDVWSTYERHEELQRLLPGSRLVAIEDSGHMVTMEQPAAVSAALLAWLEMRAPD